MANQVATGGDKRKDQQKKKINLKIGQLRLSNLSKMKKTKWGKMNRSLNLRIPSSVTLYRWLSLEGEKREKGEEKNLKK